MVQRILQIAAGLVCLLPLVWTGSPAPICLEPSDPWIAGTFNSFERVETWPLICRQPVHEYGRVMGGEPVHADFLVENLSDQPVWIETRMALAGTVAPNIQCIEPLGATVINVTLPTKYVSGLVTKSVRICEIPQPRNALAILERSARMQKN